MRSAAGVVAVLAPRASRRRQVRCAGQTLVEKITQRFAVDGNGAPVTGEVRQGDFISIKPHRVMTHDNSAAVMPKFQSLGEDVKVFNPRQPFIGLDHDVQNRSEKNVSKYAKIEAFAKEHGILFSPAGNGIAHQVLAESGLSFPGTLCVGSDSHSNMHGGIGCLGTPVVRTDAAAIWATGQTWWTVPKVTRVELTGALPPGCSGKDVIVTLCGHFNKDEVLNHAVEFTGEGVASLSVEDRLAIANMTTEWGTLAGLFPVDERTMEWLAQRQRWARKSTSPSPVLAEARHALSDEAVGTLRGQIESGLLRPDGDARYAGSITLDLGSVSPSVVGPNSVKKLQSAAQLEKQKIKIHKAYIVSCVNSRAADLASAAAVLKGKKVAPGVEFYVAPASADVRADAEASGDWQALLEAGGIPLPAGCGPCVGLGAGLLKEGEVGISATNRNFKGRMGHPQSQCYLASPAVVATSVLKGYIASNVDVDGELVGSLSVPAKAAADVREVELLEGFPETLTGQLVWCPEDNLNTDGIYAGKHTYAELTPEEMGQVAMENYDPEFPGKVKPGDVIVGGFNFGCGSSREQAATCLQFKGVPLVIAGTFSETFKRNAFNNGLAALEAPELVRYLQQKEGADTLTVATGRELVIDYRRSTVRFDGEDFPISPLGPFAQEICLAGGLEAWVRRRLSQATAA
eukprot:TRINITY_DN1203_c0_g1_i1.p1 TRINITY_DN1203_c0_g1~~TRINITY_DN1203_c0_g1_i1.p1  ORF type:complete len:687 (+),score=220.58 TRINITY_DN1203_c0_g1_i1:64-2124(+)